MTTPTHQDLAEGELGVALLHIERGDQAKASNCIATAVAGGVSVGANASLYHGAPALEFVLRCAGQIDTAVTEAVDRVVADRLAAARERRQSTAHPSLAEFDLISGLTGLGALLLLREEHTPALAQILTYLVDLAKPVNRDGWQLPGWWCDTGPSHEDLDGGHANNGMAHGAAGPLSLLSIATRQGVLVGGQDEAVNTYSHWLETYGSSYWITRDQLPDPEPVTAARPSWCYGALGIARARQLAGIALGDGDHRAMAEDAALTALTNPGVLDLTRDGGLCHGWAGLLTVTRAIAKDCPDLNRFAGSITDLGARAQADADALAKSGFLEGRAGAHLALSGNATGWTRALLID